MCSKQWEESEPSHWGNDAPGVSALSGDAEWVQGCFRVNNATTKGSVSFFSRQGTVLVALRQEAYFPISTT